MNPDSLNKMMSDSVQAINQSVPTINLGWTLVKMVFWLGVVIALIVMIWIVFKRLTGIRSFDHRTNHIRVLDRVFIGQNKSVVLLKILDKVVAFYEGPNASEKLLEWKWEDIPNEFPEETRKNSESFHQLMRKISGKN